jgi:hypothetical protein
MTKAVKEMLDALPVVEDTVTGDDGHKWLRDSALAYAITHHKNNGGMTTPPQIVDNANVFLNFLQGETK